MKLTWEQKQAIKDLAEWITDNSKDPMDALFEMRMYIEELEEEMEEKEPFDETVYFTERELL